MLPVRGGGAAVDARSRPVRAAALPAVGPLHDLAVVAGGVLLQVRFPEAGDEPMHPFEAADGDGVRVVEDDGEGRGARGGAGDLDREREGGHAPGSELGALGPVLVGYAPVPESTALDLHAGEIAVVLFNHFRRRRRPLAMPILRLR